MTTPTRPFPAIVDEILSQFIFNEQLTQDILQAVRQLIEDGMPEKKIGQWNSTYTIGELQDPNNNTHGLAYENGWNAAIDQIRRNLLERLEQ